MLVNLTPIKKEQERRKLVTKEHNFDYLPQDDKRLIQETGIYQCSFAFNFSEDEFKETETLTWSDRYEIFISKDKPFIPTKITYGVADNIEQIKEYYKEEIDDKNKKYTICVTPVWQDQCSEKDGWRWHKWGEYIGKLNPQYEYLYDENFGEDFECVLVFTLYKIK